MNIKPIGITFNVGGRLMTAEQFAGQAQKAAPKPKNEAPAAFHRGRSVEGYKPGQIAEAERFRANDIASWQALSESERAKALKDGRREPKPWDVAQYLATAKPTKVRARPFEVVSAAEQLAALAARQGWEHVRVVELAKGQRPEGLL